MIPVWLVKLATPLVTKLIKEKLGHVIGYVEEENELDVKSKEHSKRIKKLEKDTHPPAFTMEERDEINAKIKVLEKFTLKLKNKRYFKKYMDKVEETSDTDKD
jgi:hypothetical protein